MSKSVAATEDFLRTFRGFLKRVRRNQISGWSVRSRLHTVAIGADDADIQSLAFDVFLCP